MAKNHYTQRKVLYFLDWHSGELSKSAKIWLSNKFSMEFFWFFYLWIHITLGSTFFDNFNFWDTLFSKMMPNFWRLATALHQFTKYNNFFWGYLFLAINLINLILYPSLENSTTHNENAFAKTLVWNNRWTFKNKLLFYKFLFPYWNNYADHHMFLRKTNLEIS